MINVMSMLSRAIKSAVGIDVRAVGSTVGPLIDDQYIYKSLRQILGSSGDSNSVDFPYKNSIWVYACITTIARNLSKVPLNICLRDTPSKIVTTGPIVDLFNRPNPFMTKKLFIEAMSIFLNLYGEVFLLCQREKVTDVPLNIYTFNPTRFSPYFKEVNGVKYLTGWIYEGQETVPLQLHEVLLLRYFNPYDDIRGLSPLESSRMSVNQDFYTSRYNENFFKQGVSVSGFIQVEDSLNDELFNRMISQFEQRHQGYERAHKIAILEGGAKFVPSPGKTQKDFDLINLKKMNRSEILAAYKVNEVILGLYESVQCFHPDTDVMTDKGFIPVAKVKVGTKLASLDKNGKVEFKKVTKVYEYDYDGDMYTQDKGNNEFKIDYMVSPDHNMYGEMRCEPVQSDIKGFFFKKIKDIEVNKFSSPRSGTWTGNMIDTYDIGKRVYKGSAKKQGRKDTEFPIVPWLKFLGWFISEGCFVKDGKTIKITQSNKTGVNKLRYDLDDFAYDYHTHNSGHGTDFIINDKDLYSYLIDNVGRYCHEKHIPRDILELHPDLLEHLFISLMNVDGCTTGDDQYVYYTTSKQLAEDVYELAIRTGRVPTFYPTRGTEEVRYNSSDERDNERVVNNRRPLYKIRIASKKSSKNMSVLRPTTVHYKGKIHCFEVPPHHTVLSRYNGRIIWCGNSYEGIKMADRAFWRECMVPHLSYIEEYLNLTLLSQIENGKFVVKFDLDAIGSLHEDYQTRVETANTMARIGFPINDINDRLELGMPKYKWGDVWWVPMGMVPADVALAQGGSFIHNNDEAPVVKPPTNPNKPSEKPPKPGEKPLEKPTKPTDGPAKPAKIEDDEQTRVLWQRYVSVQLRVEELMKSKIKKFVFDLRKSALENLGKDKDILIDKKREIERFKKLMSTLYIDAINIGANMVTEELGSSSVVSFSLEFPEVIKYLQLRVSLVPSRIIEKISLALEKIVKDNEIKELKVESVKMLFNKITKRVSTIARTESSSLLVAGRVIQMFRNGVRYHKWVAARRDNPRESHMYLNNQIVKIGNSFSPDFTLRFPGDLMAPIEETMGCTCFTVMAVKIDD